MDLGGFNFSASELLAGFIFGVIGLYYFRKGRKDTDYRVLFAGIGLMVYPYFISGSKMTWFVGLCLWGLAYYWRNYN